MPDLSVLRWELYVVGIREDLSPHEEEALACDMVRRSIDISLRKPLIYCCKQFVDPTCSVKNHCGGHPQILRGVLEHHEFPILCEFLLDDMVTRCMPLNVRACNYVDLITYCHRGRHRSIAVAQFIADLIAVCGGQVEVHNCAHLEKRVGCEANYCQTCFGTTQERKVVFEEFRHFWATAVMSQYEQQHRPLRM